MSSEASAKTAVLIRISTSGQPSVDTIRSEHGSGRTFWRAHLITGERVEFRCTQMRVRPDPLILGKEFTDEGGGTESHSDG